MHVAHEVAGSGEPLLLVSGLGQTGRRWRRVVPLLADTYTVVTFDNRETGATGACEEGFTLADIATDALDLMTSLGFERFFLAGISMGGMISQEIIRIGGAQRVRGAALFSTHGGASIAVQPADMGVLMPAPGDGRPVWAKLAGPGFWEAHPQIIDEETQLSIEQATQPAGYMRQMQAIQAFDPSEDAVRSTGVPVVVAHGSADPLVPYENGVRLAKRLGVELVTYEGSGHVLECEVPDQMAALIRRHFDGS
jgi:pimeloyl-ACP methyl ester carboxylesterase